MTYLNAKRSVVPWCCLPCIALQDMSQNCSPEGAPEGLGNSLKGSLETHCQVMRVYVSPASM